MEQTNETTNNVKTPESKLRILGRILSPIASIATSGILAYLMYTTYQQEATIEKLTRENQIVKSVAVSGQSTMYAIFGGENAFLTKRRAVITVGTDTIQLGDLTRKAVGQLVVNGDTLLHSTADTTGATNVYLTTIDSENFTTSL